MRYHTPAGFGQRCAIRNDADTHQIRIFHSHQKLKVGCTCQPLTDRDGTNLLSGPAGLLYKPLATIKTADQAWRAWRRHHGELVRVVAP